MYEMDWIVNHLQHLPNLQYDWTPSILFKHSSQKEEEIKHVIVLICQYIICGISYFNIILKCQNMVKKTSWCVKTFDWDWYFRAGADLA